MCPKKQQFQTDSAKRNSSTSPASRGTCGRWPPFPHPKHWASKQWLCPLRKPTNACLNSGPGDRALSVRSPSSKVTPELLAFTHRPGGHVSSRLTAETTDGGRPSMPDTRADRFNTVTLQQVTGGPYRTVRTCQSLASVCIVTKLSKWQSN